MNSWPSSVWHGAHSTFSSPALAMQDTLAKVKQKGVLVAGVKDSLPPFGYVDETTRRIVGYDVDFVKAIADKLGVKLELKAVTSASRMPQLTEGNIDIIAATMTKTPERAKQIDFSHAYFFTGQKFLVKKGTVKSLADLAGQKDRYRQGVNIRAECRQGIAVGYGYSHSTIIPRLFWRCSRERSLP